MSKEPAPVGEFTTPYRWTKNDPLWIPEISDQHRVRYERLKVDLKVEENAHRDGALNEPGAEDTTLSEPQLRIQERIFQGVTLLNEFLAEQLNAASHNMIGDDQRLDATRRKNEVDAEIDQLLAANARLVDAKEAAIAAERNFRFFRARNGLRRQPDYRESPWLFWSVLFGLLVLESFANGYVFQGVNPGGLSGGILLAMGISLVNIGLGLIGGMVGWRLMGHRSMLGKAFGVAVTIATLVLALTWNLYIAHYREAAEHAIERMHQDDAAISAQPTLNEEGISTDPLGAAPVSPMGDLFGQARDTFVGDPLGLSTLMAWVLFGVGMIVFLLACREAWEDLADRYWGYKKVHWTAREKRTAFDDACEDVNEDVLEHLDEALSEFRSQAARVRQNAARSHAVAGLAEQRLQEVRASEGSWVSEGNRLIKLYRDENSSVRDNAAGVPAYWQIYPDVDDYRYGRFSGGAGPASASHKNYELGAALIDEIRTKEVNLHAIVAHNREALAAFEDHIHARKAALPARLARLRTEVEAEADRRLGPDEQEPGGYDGDER